MNSHPVETCSCDICAEYRQAHYGDRTQMDADAASFFMDMASRAHKYRQEETIERLTKERDEARRQWSAAIASAITLRKERDDARQFHEEAIQERNKITDDLFQLKTEIMTDLMRLTQECNTLYGFNIEFHGTIREQVQRLAGAFKSGVGTNRFLAEQKASVPNTERAALKRQIEELAKRNTQLDERNARQADVLHKIFELPGMQHVEQIKELPKRIKDTLDAWEIKVEHEIAERRAVENKFARLKELLK